MLDETIEKVNRPRYKKTANGFQAIEEHQPEPVPKPEPVKAKEPERIRVKKEPPPEPEQSDAAVKLINHLTCTPCERLGETTYLSKTMAFLISLEQVMKPENIFDPSVDIVEEWEKAYFRLQRSVGGEHIDRLSRLTEIQMAGNVDDDLDGSGLPSM